MNEEDEYILLKIKKDFSEVKIMNKTRRKSDKKIEQEIEKVYKMLGLKTEIDECEIDECYSAKFYRYDYTQKSILDISTHARIGG